VRTHTHARVEWASELQGEKAVAAYWLANFGRSRAASVQ